MSKILKSLTALGFMVLIPCLYTVGQVGINTDNSAPDNSAILDVKSASKGILPPRVALVAANFPDPVVLPTKGIVVYNTAISGVSPNMVCPGLYWWNGRRWVRFNDGVTCSSTTLPDNCYQDNTVTDRDGNIYPTIILGDKEWMATNLKVTHYRNGDAIPLVTDNGWAYLISGARCYFNNDSVTNKPIYGALYNWYAVNDGRKICPTGWHVPTHDEWFYSLYSWIGSPGGGKLKETGTAHWSSPNTGATNETCFSGLPGGWRMITISSPPFAFYQNMGSYANWWSATANIIEYLQNNNTGNFWWTNMDSGYGASVRCVKD
jgi:uncharacterized protein (TIGR02145 family)